MKSEVTRCGLCNCIIEEPDGDGMLWPGRSQVWPTPQGERDICSKCIRILGRAAVLGLIPKIDEAQFYERAGWEWHENYWKYVGGRKR